jgi:hypothetical protein
MDSDVCLRIQALYTCTGQLGYGVPIKQLDTRETGGGCLREKEDSRNYRPDRPRASWEKQKEYKPKKIKIK